MNEVTDTNTQEQEVSQTVDTSVDTDETLNDLEATQAQDNTEDLEEANTEQEQVSHPFAAGKEKFKINGKEVEWDWNETKRYAQIGAAGYKAMQEAAEVKKQFTETYKNLRHLAQHNPLGLIETLGGRPNFQAQTSETGQGQKAPTEQRHDPRDERIQTLEGRLEQYEIQQELKVFESELSDAMTKFPELNDDIYKAYVKNQYKALLKSGVEDVSVEDVAFQVSQKLKRAQAQKQAAMKQKIQTKQQSSPVSGRAAAPSNKPKEYDLEDVMRLAGRA